MSISVDWVDPIVSFSCDGCKKRGSESEISAVFCVRCREDGTIDDPKRKKGQPIREWADRQKLLGRITAAEEELLLRLARDLDEARASTGASS